MAKLKRYYGVHLPYRTTEVERGWVLARSGGEALAKFIIRTGYLSILSEPNLSDVEVEGEEYSLGYDGDAWIIREGRYPRVEDSGDIL